MDANDQRLALSVRNRTQPAVRKASLPVPPAKWSCKDRWRNLRKHASQQFPFPPEKIGDKHDQIALKAIATGARYEIDLGAKLTLHQCKSFSKVLRR